MTIIDRIYGVTEGIAIKAPCRVATTANIAFSGLQSIDGVTLAAGDRVLVKDQSNAVENGIYIVSTGLWLRTKDFDGAFDIVTGSQVFVTSGTVGANRFYAVTSAAPVIGTSAITFQSTAATFFSDNTGTAFVPTRATIPSIAFDPSIVSVLTGGYAVSGDRGAGAIYTNQGAGPGGPGAIQDLSGTWFQLVIGHDAIHVGWFGAKGDGVTDDTISISNAIAAIPGHGARLYFPGIYLTTGGFTLANPTYVYGDGMGSNIWPSSVPQTVSQIICSSSTAVLFTVTARFAEFADIQMTCTAATPSAGAAVFSNGAVQTQVVNFDRTCVNGFYDNIHLGVAGYGWHYQNNHNINPVRYGLFITNTVNGDAGGYYIIGNYFAPDARNSTAGLYIESSGQPYICNNTFNIGLGGGKFVNGIKVNSTTTTVQGFICDNTIDGVSGVPLYMPVAWPQICINNNCLSSAFNAAPGPCIVASGILTGYIGGGTMLCPPNTPYLIDLAGSFFITIGPMNGSLNADFILNPANPTIDSTLFVNDLSRFAAPINNFGRNVIGPIDPRTPGLTGSVLTGANYVIYSEFQVSRPVAISQARFGIKTQGGNIDVGIYNYNPNAVRYDKLVSTGSIACPADGGPDAALGFHALSSTILNPGVQYVAAFATDSATCSVVCSVISPPFNFAPTGPAMTQAASFPLPATLPSAGTQAATAPVIIFD